MCRVFFESINVVVLPDYSGYDHDGAAVRPGTLLQSPETDKT